MKIFINTDTFKQIAIRTQENLIKSCEELNIDTVADITEADFVFSIGGDGTFLKTAKLTDKPIVGINTGTLGYLTEVNQDNLTKTLQKILDNEYETENRMMIEGEILRQNGEKVRIPESLNEIAIAKDIIGIVRFDAIVNDKLINSYTADGILVCTPTGSTAYNLSCGGPIVDPTAEILTLTPIAPHSVINRSIVLSKKSVVKIKITELRTNTHAYAVYDGTAIEVFTGDIISIKKSDKITKIIKLEDVSFIDNVRENIN